MFNMTYRQVSYLVRGTIRGGHADHWYLATLRFTYSTILIFFRTVPIGPWNV
jgi:hypothetical protein